MSKGCSKRFLIPIIFNIVVNILVSLVYIYNIHYTLYRDTPPGEGEDNVSLRRAISKLSELETNLEQVHLEQADNDQFTFGETIKDYISIIQSAKVYSLSDVFM